MKLHVPEVLYSQYSISVVDAIFHRPIFKSKDFARISLIPEKTAPRIVKYLIKKRTAVYNTRRGGQIHAMQIIFSGTIMAPSRRFPFEREQNGDHRQPCRA